MLLSLGRVALSVGLGIFTDLAFDLTGMVCPSYGLGLKIFIDDTQLVTDAKF